MENDAMEPTEIQARAIIAAALIMSHAVEIPSVPKSGTTSIHDQAAMRLRELTNYVYDSIVPRQPSAL